MIRSKCYKKFQNIEIHSPLSIWRREAECLIRGIMMGVRLISASRASIPLLRFAIESREKITHRFLNLKFAPFYRHLADCSLILQNIIVNLQIRYSLLILIYYLWQNINHLI